MTQVRRFEPEDASALGDFFAAIVANGSDRYFRPHPFTQGIARAIANHEGQDEYYGAWQRGEMVGYLMLRGYDEGYAVPSLGVCVHPNYQGRGIGKLLVKYAQQVSHAQPAIRLRVHPDNHRARLLYERCGFAFSGIRERGEYVGIWENPSCAS